MRRRHHGFTLIELLAVIAVIGLLASLLIAAMWAARVNGDKARCVSNLRQWAAALGAYEGDNAGNIPRRGQGVQPVMQLDRPDDWFNCLPPYLGLPSYQTMAFAGTPPQPHTNSVFVCPSATPTGTPNFMAYAMNMYLSPWIRPSQHIITEIAHPSTLVFMADGPGGYSSTVPSALGYSVPARHNNCANILFLDGHVGTFTGAYLGCGKGAIEQPDVQWQTGTGGVNQSPVP